jgi:hypothetical protein
MASDYDNAGRRVGHNLYILRSVAEDIVKGFSCDASERRHITEGRRDLADVFGALQTILTSIDNAATSRPAQGILP